MIRPAQDEAVVSRHPGLGIVAIGRNEGERLVRCIRSVAGLGVPLVYVDSNSTDGSPARASELNAVVVQLDLSVPFTAARARNAGFNALAAREPDLRFVQFVDGDCEVVHGWIPAALAFLASRPDVGVVCGRRRERDPDASVYNMLCDIEWDTPLGEALACGGDAMMRAEAFRQAGGFRDGLIAGEEPELCVRIRAHGWKIHRLDHEMTLHDAAITRFDQWWKRNVRAGHAFAEGAYLHGRPPERHWVRETRSSLLWGAALPAAIVLAVVILGPQSLLLALVYPAQALRLALRERGSIRRRTARAFFLVLGKFAEAMGAIRFALRLRQGGPHSLIEYK